MLLEPYSYDGTLLQGSNYFSTFEENWAWGFQPVGARWSSRGIFAQVFIGKESAAKILPLNVYVQNKPATADGVRDVLADCFNTLDNTEKLFIAKDKATGKLWQVYAVCSAFEPGELSSEDQAFKVVLEAGDSVWQESVLSTKSKAIAASGDSLVVTNEGNTPAYAIYSLTPGAVKNAGYTYKKYVLLYNQTDTQFTDVPYDFTNGGLDTAALVKVAALHAQVNLLGGITAVQTTIPIDTDGGLPAFGSGWIDDGGNSEQISWTGKAGGNMTGVVRGLGGTTGHTHADNTVIYQSKTLANGYDFRLIIDGVEPPRWLYGFNTAATQLWANLNLVPRIELSLLTPVAGVGAVASLVFKKSSATQALLKRLPASGKLLIGTEIFTFSAVDVINCQVTGCVRAERGTSAGAHALNDIARFIEHDIYIAYGKAAATDPALGNSKYDQKKPMLDLNSTNISWVWSVFTDDTGLRGGAWQQVLTSSKYKAPYLVSHFYTAAGDADASPATDMGMSIQPAVNGSSILADTLTMHWQVYHPSGFTTVTTTGRKYRTGAGAVFTSPWPVATLGVSSKLGGSWVTKWTEVTPAAGSTWTALAAHAAVALGATYNWLRHAFIGSSSKTAGSQAAFEIAGVTAVVDNAKVPYYSLGAEVSATYALEAELHNLTTTEFISINLVMEVGNILVIDDQELTVMSGNTPCPGAVVTDTARDYYLMLAPGANTLQYIEDGTPTLTLQVDWHNRSL
jgi:hypothetical protein